MVEVKLPIKLMGKINKTVSIDPAPTGGKCDPRKSQSHIPKPSIEPSTEMKRRSFDKLVKSYKNWAKLVKLISLEVYGCTVNCETVEKIYVDKFTKLASNNGKKYAITYLKQVRSHIYQFIASDVQTLGSNVKVTHDGIPVFLGDIIPVVRKRCKSTLRVLLSFSNIGRLYKNVGKVDTSNIVHESALDTQKSISRNTISNYIRHYSLFNSNTRNVVDNPVFYIRSSNGPFGPAMTSVMEEAKYLTPIMIECIQKLDHKIMDGSSKYKIADLIREIRHGNIDIPSE